MKLWIRNPGELLTDPDRWPGRAADPGDTEAMPYFIIRAYRAPRIGPWSRWKNPGSAPGTPGSA